MCWPWIDDKVLHIPMENYISVLDHIEYFHPRKVSWKWIKMGEIRNTAEKQRTKSQKNNKLKVKKLSNFEILT